MRTVCTWKPYAAGRRGAAGTRAAREGPERRGTHAVREGPVRQTRMRQEKARRGTHAAREGPARQAHVRRKGAPGALPRPPVGENVTEKDTFIRITACKVLYTFHTIFARY